LAEYTVGDFECQEEYPDICAEDDTVYEDLKPIEPGMALYSMGMEK